jgi:hypothetical protein
VIYSDPVTTIIWADGTKTQSRCDERDNFDELTGFMMCVFKKVLKHKDMRKMFDTFVYGNDKHYVKRDNKKEKRDDKKEKEINLNWLGDIIPKEWGIEIKPYTDFSPACTYSNGFQYSDDNELIEEFDDILNRLAIIFKE